MASGEQSQTTVSWEELIQTYIQRARGVMIDYYAADEHVYIYGLYLQKAQPNGSLWDVVDLVKNDEGEVEEVIYLNTIDASKFVSARDLANRIKQYYVEYADTGDEPEPDEQGDTDDPDPTRTFQ